MALYEATGGVEGYVVVASVGGARTTRPGPHNLRVDPRCDLQDGAVAHETVASEVAGDEKARWWSVATQVWPAYDDYQAATDRVIPTRVREILLRSLFRPTVLSEVGSRVVVMRDLLFPSSPVHRGALAESARLQARGWVMECRAIVGMYESADPGDVDFVHGDVAGTLHLSPRTAQAKAATAMALLAQPRLVAAVEHGQLGVAHAMAVLDEISHLDPPTATRVLAEVLGDESALEATPGELRKAVKKAAIDVDTDAARKRHAEAKKTAGVRTRPGVDGMGRVVIDCTATEAATILASVRQRAAVMPFDDPDLTEGQKQVAALLHALGCDRVAVQAVLECPVDRAIDLHAAASAGVWGVDIRMPIAVALGLSDHPAVLAGYGPIGADEARALLPAADLVRACVDSSTGEVLAVDRPVRAKTWQAGDPALSKALRDALVQMATSEGLIQDLTCDGYVPSEALGRLVDLRDVTSVFPGDATSTRRTDRDHRLPYPLGPTAEWNLQNLTRRWHRAKQAGWHTRALTDGVIQWTSPSRGVYLRKPQRTIPPKIPPGGSLPPLPD